MIPPDIIPYLRQRFLKGDAVLFTGAGFSAGAPAISGRNVPNGLQLREQLWRLVYPDLAFDAGSALTDLFELARTKTPGPLRNLLESEFRVARSAIPEYYELIHALSWKRVYTLNIDDLDDAIAATAILPRRLNTVSASDADVGDGDALEVVHLNGKAADGPDRVTFSTPQYGRRFPGADAVYQQAAVDVLGSTVVFIGTQLNEPPLWTHIELRKLAHGRDLRRRSFLVTPELDRAKRDYLERELKVEYVPLHVDEFADQILRPARDGATTFFATKRQPSLWETASLHIPRVPELIGIERARAPEEEFLLGYAPFWQDVMSGKAAVREFEEPLAVTVKGQLDSGGLGPKPVVIITGTAGCGKSTTCMHLALGLHATGMDVGWLDADAAASPRQLRDLGALGQLPEILFMDDADRYGAELPLLAADLARSEKRPLVVLGVRSGRVERIADRMRLQGALFEEVVVPFLTDHDIHGLLAVLDKNNRLGNLRGKTPMAQLAEFRDAERASRQLLVAMLEVTSGRPFAERIREELDQLAGTARFIYAMVAVATAYRFGLTRDQILLGIEDASNESLQALDDLKRRLLLIETPFGDLRVRHRVVGEKTVEHLVASRSLLEPLRGIAIALAAQLGPHVRRNSRVYRNLRQLMNHDWLKRSLGLAAASQLMADLEPYLTWDYHYWLQRGSLELEAGHEGLAENFLGQAAGMQPNDFLVQTELGYLRLRQAVRDPNGNVARELYAAGLQQLRGVILSRDHFDPHQYDIVGRQTLLFVRRGDVGAEEADGLLQDAGALVDAGRAKHPRDEHLRELIVSIHNERLGLGRLP
jgi:hypothetical protein